MLLFVLIGLSLVLLGIVGLQFTYMFYMERMNGERRKHMQALEHKAEQLTEQLDATRRQLAELNEVTKREEIWADVLDEH